jgi:hypothetical protein
MEFRNILILDNDKNKKGDLFGRLLSDVFHTLGYDKPRLNIHKTGREIDLLANHRMERKLCVAEFKAHNKPIGGADINKFIGVLDAEKRRLKKDNISADVVGYFVSLSGYTETALEQEILAGEERLILLDSKKIVQELIAGKIIVTKEEAISNVTTELKLVNHIDLIAHETGWIWLIYYSSNHQTPTHYSLIHAEGKPLVRKLVTEIIKIDSLHSKALIDLTLIDNFDETDNEKNLKEAKEKYYKYIKHECGEIQFEGLPIDKESGSVRVQLENIFVPLNLEQTQGFQENTKNQVDNLSQRESIGKILKTKRKLAILAKPGGGKSTLIKRLAIAYAFPERRDLINDSLPDKNWFPIFIRCRELGEKVSSSITDIINNLPNRAEINQFSKEFFLLSSEALQTGNALLLIDGLDEIAEDRNRINFVNQLRTFLATYPNINLIVTSREAGFRAVGGTLAEHCSHYKISNLDKTEIEQLVVRWHKSIIDESANTIAEALSLADLIVKDSRIKVLAENPLLLTTLLFVKRWAGYLPTKKSILYQEMTKLLLVTWNVEGHEQLDIDESEPQLAYIAFCMTVNGTQTININELKKYLQQARKEMPEILEYTKISVAEFIKNVESRSSLLIMTGHQKTESGELLPIYEFLHLSFQEYLTSKAIVEKFLPIEYSTTSSVEILQPKILQESWKEIFPIVAVLSKRHAKNLIEMLISEVENNTSEDDIPMQEISPVEHLGQCIANDIQITPELLEKAIESYAKNHFKIFQTERLIKLIVNSKFGNVFIATLKKLFFKNNLDRYHPPIAAALAESNLEVLGINSVDTFDEIHKNLNSDNNENVCIGLLTLMEVAFIIAVDRIKYNETLFKHSYNKIKKSFVSLYNSKDNHVLFSLTWATVWMQRMKSFPSQDRKHMSLSLLEIWSENEYQKICRNAAWALIYTLNPDYKITITEDLKTKAIERYNNPFTTFDRQLAIIIGYHGNIWDTSDLKLMVKQISENSEDLKQEYKTAIGIE